MDSTLTCIFLNSNDTSEKSCNVRYGQCGQEMRTVSGYSSNNSVTVSLQLSTVYISVCYIVTASNGSFTVIVEGIAGTSTLTN